MGLTGSKDLQMVTIAVRVLHKPNPNKLVWIYQTLGMNYDERILPSVMNESAKAIVARYNANELLTKRDLVSRAISEDLQRRASQFNIVLDDVAITHLSFSPEYARAVEAKQVAQQDAERAKYIVIGAQQEKQTIITKARGEAESATLIGTAVKKNPGFMKLRRIDAAKEIATIVSKSGNKIYLNADSLLLNLLGDADDKLKRVWSKKIHARGVSPLDEVLHYHNSEFFDLCYYLSFYLYHSVGMYLLIKAKKCKSKYLEFKMIYRKVESFFSFQIF